MTKFEYEFILRCLNFLQEILADPALLNEAIAGYCNGDATNTRYQQHSKITDSKSWSSDDILAAVAAFSEAVTITLKIYGHDLHTLHDITHITEKLLDVYLPLITTESNPCDRLGSMQFQIAQIKADIKNEFQTTNQTVNAYSFFALTIAAASAAVTTVLALK